MARHRPRHRVEGLWRQDRDRGQPPKTRVRRRRMMHGPFPDQTGRSNAPAGNTLVAAFERVLAFCNNVIVVLAAVALVAACAILSYSVLSRALFHSANYWQDEARVRPSVRATLMAAGSVRGQRAP